MSLFISKVDLSVTPNMSVNKGKIMSFRKIYHNFFRKDFTDLLFK